MKIQFLLAFTLCLIIHTSYGWGSSGHKKIRLRDVDVITLHAGKMTTSRRTSAVPQIQCVGGSGQGAYNPQVIQCYNRGWDGVDVQWECKADMDNEFRFGDIEVVCEGYDYPDDEYILAGSCGLEYRLEYTKGGHEKQQYRQDSHSQGYGWKQPHSNYGPAKESSGFAGIIFLAIVCILIYALYKTCIEMPQNQYSSTSDDHPGGDSPGYGWNVPSGGGAPPPAAHRPSYGGDGCGQNRGGGQRNPFGGFWSGAATGGILGYMFGNQGQGYGGGYRQRPGWFGSGAGYTGGFGSRGSGFGSGGSGFSSGGSGFSGGSTGTRTASGFGSTRRR